MRAIIVTVYVKLFNDWHWGCIVIPLLEEIILPRWQVGIIVLASHFRHHFSVGPRLMGDLNGERTSALCVLGAFFGMRQFVAVAAAVSFYGDFIPFDGGSFFTLRLHLRLDFHMAWASCQRRPLSSRAQASKSKYSPWIYDKSLVCAEGWVSIPMHVQNLWEFYSKLYPQIHTSVADFSVVSVSKNTKLTTDLVVNFAFFGCRWS